MQVVDVDFIAAVIYFADLVFMLLVGPVHQQILDGVIIDFKKTGCELVLWKRKEQIVKKKLKVAT